MKTSHLLVASLFLIAFLVFPNLAQTAAVQPASGKIVIINSFAFADAKTGINKYVNAVKTLETEFKPIQTELSGIELRLQTLAKEIQSFRDNAAKNVPVNQATVNAKIEEAEKLQRDLKFRQEDARARLERREQSLFTPIMQDIYKSVQEFSKQKGFVLVLDIAKMEQSGMAMAWDDKADVTKEFIAFYNARPAGTAAGAP